MTTETKPNVELMRKTLDYITAHPETWDQSEWVCGTNYCFGGWATVLAGHTLERVPSSGNFLVDGAVVLYSIYYRLSDFLGVSMPIESDNFFDGSNSLQHLTELVELYESGQRAQYENFMCSDGQCGSCLVAAAEHER